MTATPSHSGEGTKLNAFFSGTSSFPMQKRFADMRGATVKGQQEAAKEFAKLRFNIGIEAAKKTEMLKQIEEHEVREAERRRREAEAHAKKMNLTNAQNLNLKLSAQVKAGVAKEREEWIKEKDNIQTSLKSKKDDDINERIRMNIRKDALTEMFTKNLADTALQTTAVINERNTKLADEKLWLSEIKEAEKEESNFLENLRRERINDLRITYKEQATDKRERDKHFMKL